MNAVCLGRSEQHPITTASTVYCADALHTTSFLPGMERKLHQLNGNRGMELLSWRWKASNFFVLGFFLFASSVYSFLMTQDMDSVLFIFSLFECLLQLM